MKTYENKPNKVMIGPVRLSYMNVFKPRTSTNAQGKTSSEYSVVALIPKEPHKRLENGKEEYDALSAVINEIAKERFPKLPEKNPLKPHLEGWQNPLKDGDTERDKNDEPKYPGYWFIGASSYAVDKDGNEKDGPLIRNGLGEPIGEKSGYVSGDWGKVIIYLSPYDNSTKGIKAYLNGVQLLYKDEPFAKGQADEFEPVPDADTYNPFEDSE